mmetsp:Transcript_2540/g.7753  ORF Transcript_2540/g.7753 Transcript_2540/m.7753 type:complete len:245 (-) Transcript_2540:2793-3527(-)
MRGQPPHEVVHVSKDLAETPRGLWGQTELLLELGPPLGEDPLQLNGTLVHRVHCVIELVAVLKDLGDALPDLLGAPKDLGLEALVNGGQIHRPRHNLLVLLPQSWVPKSRGCNRVHKVGRPLVFLQHEQELHTLLVLEGGELLLIQQRGAGRGGRCGNSGGKGRSLTLLPALSHSLLWRQGLQLYLGQGHRDLGDLGLLVHIHRVGRPSVWNLRLDQHGRWRWGRRGVNIHLHWRVFLKRLLLG